MKGILKHSLLAGLIATGGFGVLLLPTHPAAADLIQDVAVGAATNTVAGEVLNNGNTLDNAIGGAAAGAAVSVTHNEASSTVPSLVQDAAVGAAATVVTGEILNNGNLVDNAIGGAVTGVVVGVTTD